VSQARNQKKNAESKDAAEDFWLCLIFDHEDGVDIHPKQREFSELLGITT
jgi:hypothetical protein